MIDITYFIKKFITDSDSQKTEKNKITIERPETFDELVEKIKTEFKLDGKEFSVKMDIDNEEVNVNDKNYANDKSLKYYVYEIVKENEEVKLDVNSILNLDNELKFEENDFEKLLNQKIEIETNKEDIKFEDISKFEIKNDLFNYFKDDFNKDISAINENKKKTFLDSIKNEFFSFDEKIDEKIGRINLDINNNVKQTKETKNTMTEMNKYIPSLLPVKGKQLPKMFNISSNKKDIEISEDEADSFKIDDIIIKNITNQVVSFKNKYWVRHEDSTENIDICPDKKEIKIDDDIGINKEKTTSIDLFIKNPDINKNYFIKLYIGDNSQDNTQYENVTDNSLFFYIKLKKKEEDIPNEDDDNEIKEKIEGHNKQSPKKTEPIKFNNQEIKEEKPKEEIQPKKEEKKDEKIEQNNNGNNNDNNNNNNNNNDNNNDNNKNNNNNNNNDDNVLTEERIQELYDQFENDYYISGFIDEDEFREKAIQYGGDIAKLKEYVEGKM